MRRSIREKERGNDKEWQIKSKELKWCMNDSDVFNVLIWFCSYYRLVYEKKLHITHTKTDTHLIAFSIP